MNSKVMSTVAALALSASIAAAAPAPQRDTRSYNPQYQHQNQYQSNGQYDRQNQSQYNGQYDRSPAVADRNSTWRSDWQNVSRRNLITAQAAALRNEIAQTERDYRFALYQGRGARAAALRIRLEREQYQLAQLQYDQRGQFSSWNGGRDGSYRH